MTFFKQAFNFYKTKFPITKRLMSDSTINFVHANGFPARSYQTIFDNIPTHIKVIALDKYGHSDLYPVENNWQASVDELLDFVKNNHQGSEKIISVGHSFGGVVAFMAACQNPALFKGVIMLDPPVFVGPSALVVRIIKKTSLIDKFSPAGKSKKRRSHWPLDSDIKKQFSRRKLFRDFDSRCLTDYVKHGIVERNNQLELAFSAEVEANIFRTLPCNLSSFKNKLTIPGALIYAEKTDVCPQHFFKRFAKLNKKITIRTVPGGHMFPLERPEETAKLITEIINNF